jgi:putative phage-type endonuclease
VLKVTSSDERWLKPGVGSTDIAALVGCGAVQDQAALVTWAKIVQKTELAEIKKMKKQTLVQGSDIWRQWRKDGIGGSEVACVVGANPYSDSKADKIWARKLPEDHPNSKPEVSDNDAMAKGRKYEPEARRIYETLFDWNARDVCVLHDDYSFIRCSLDGLRDDDDLVLEIKCPWTDKNHTKYLEISRIEDNFERQTAFATMFNYYRMQVLYQLLITNARVCHFVSYFPNWKNEKDRFALITLYPEPYMQDFLLRRAIEFWKFVETRTPPPKEWLEPCWEYPTELKIRS